MPNLALRALGELKLDSAIVVQLDGVIGIVRELVEILPERTMAPPLFSGLTLRAVPASPVTSTFSCSAAIVRGRSTF